MVQLERHPRAWLTRLFLPTVMVTTMSIGCSCTPPDDGSPVGAGASVEAGGPIAFEPSSDSTVPTAVVCRRERAAQGAALAVLDAITLARENDRRCGTPQPGLRLCRAIFAASVTDPILAFVADGAFSAGVVDAHRWALDEGLASSEGEVAVAFGILLGLLDAMPGPADEPALSVWITNRADPRVIRPIAEAERACGGGG